MTGISGQENQETSKGGAPNQSGNGASKNLLEGSPISETVTEDPLFQFLNKNWRQIVVVAIAAVLVYVARNAYLRTYHNTMKGAADVFAITRQQFSKLTSLESQILVAEQAEKEKASDDAEDTTKKDAAASGTELERLRTEKKEVLGRLGQNLNALQQEHEPYSKIGQLYSGLLAAHSDDSSKAMQALTTLPLENVSADLTTERLVAELATLNLARVKIDDDKQLEVGRQTLKTLAQEGVFVHVTAALTLAGLAEGPDEKEEALKLLEAIASKHPEQIDLVQDEIDRLRL